jgi:hypothetical protein
MEQKTTPSRPRRRRGRAGKVSKTVVCEDRVLSVAVPEGSRFKGYEDFTIQEMERHRQVGGGAGCLSSVGQV